MFFTDFKAGEDPRYVLRDPDNTQNRLEFALQLYGDKLLDDKDTRELIKLNNDPIQYKMMLRKYRVLRWSLDEIIKGVKERFDFTSGLDPDTLPPMVDFKMEDAQEFMLEED